MTLLNILKWLNIIIGYEGVLNLFGMFNFKSDQEGIRGPSQ